MSDVLPEFLRQVKKLTSACAKTDFAHPTMLTKCKSQKLKIKIENTKCKIKEVIDAKRRFHNFDF